MFVEIIFFPGVFTVLLSHVSAITNVLNVQKVDCRADLLESTFIYFKY